MRALVSFLGLSDYQEASYRWGSEVSKPTKYVLLAILELLKRKGEQVNQVFLLITEKVKEKLENHPDERREIEEGVKALAGTNLRYVLIPTPKSEDGLWELFDRLRELTGGANELILDVTHAFRVIPIVSVTTAVFMKHLKALGIKHILYGAFEAKVDNVAPIWDLKAMVELADWLESYKVFRRLGDLSLLVDELEAMNFEELTDIFKKLNDAIHLCQVLDIMKLSNKLGNFNLQELYSLLPEPAVDMLRNVVSEFEGMRCETPERLTRSNLNAQLNILKFYKDKRFYSLFFILAREVLMNFFIVLKRREEAHRWLDEKFRREFEDKLHSVLKSLRGDIELSELVPLWDKLRNDYRNLIAHAQMSRRSVKPHEIEGEMDKVLRVLERAFYSRRMGSVKI